MSLRSIKEGISVINIVNLLWMVTVVYSLGYHVSVGMPKVITWDVYGYYLYLPALLKYGDTTQYLFALDHISNYGMSTDLYQLIDWNGAKAPIYTIGMSILYLPFYLVADLIAWIVPAFKADGMSPVYQWAIITASWVYTYIGMYFTGKLLMSLKFNRSVIILTLLIIFLGTNYFHYAAFENGMPHIYLYALYALLLYLTYLWHHDAKMKYVITGGLVYALMCLVRPSEVIAIVIPLSYGIYNGLSGLIKIQRVMRYRGHIITMVVVGLSLIMLQVIFWKVNLGKWVFNGYAGHHFDFIEPHIWEGLFSFRKGWLVYSPLCILAIPGIPLLWRRDKRFFLPVMLFFVINIFIVLSWHIWWYASSFGMRALVQSYAVLALPVAVIIERIMISRWMKAMGMITIALFITLNFFQDWQYRNRILLQDEMNSTFYRKSFLMTNLDKDLRKYIDNEEIYTGNKQPFLFRGIDTSYFSLKSSRIDTIHSGNFGYTHKIPLEEFTKTGIGWVNIDAEVLMLSDKFDDHRQARIVTAIKNDNDNLKWTGVRFQRMIEPREWSTVSYDFNLELYGKGGEYLEVTIWNNGPDTILMKTLDIYGYN